MPPRTATNAFGGEDQVGRELVTPRCKLLLGACKKMFKS